MKKKIYPLEEKKYTKEEMKAINSSIDHMNGFDLAFSINLFDVIKKHMALEKKET